MNGKNFILCICLTQALRKGTHHPWVFTRAGRALSPSTQLRAWLNFGVGLLNKANNDANAYNTEPLLMSFGLLIRCFPAHAICFTASGDFPSLVWCKRTQNYDIMTPILQSGQIRQRILDRNKKRQTGGVWGCVFGTDTLLRGHKAPSDVGLTTSKK